MNLQGRNLSLQTPPLQGPDVALLQRELGLLGIIISVTERRDAVFSTATHEAVMRFQRQHNLQPQNGIVDAETVRTINAALVAATFTVEGRVVSRERAGVGGLSVEIVDKNVGEEVSVATTTTDAAGAYQVTFVITEPLQRGKSRPDLQARVLRGEELLGRSETLYDATNRARLNIILSPRASTALPTEHDTLVSAIGVHHRGALRDLKETESRQDISYLAHKTGWDARAVALAALADQFSNRTTSAGVPHIAAPLFYALFRAGIPANEDALYQMAPQTAIEIWQQAGKQGVIATQSEHALQQAATQFQRIAAVRSLDTPAPVGLSRLREILTVSLGDNRDLQEAFAAIYVEHRHEPTKLWAEVRRSLGEVAERRLRLDGQLGYLTRNNAPLMRKLHAAAGQGGLRNTDQLVELGYYRAIKWQELIGEDAIPPEVPGERATERRTRYAELLAAQVRLSFPTAVVAQMVQAGETPVSAERRGQVHGFLREHQGRFELGVQPVERYVALNQLQVQPEVVKELTRIQRVFQISPSDDAMNALLRRGVDSARAVARYDREQFIREFQNELGGEANARLTHAKAQQVHNIVLNLATSYLVARTAPQIGVHSPAKYGKTMPSIITDAQDAVALNQTLDIQTWLRDDYARRSPTHASDVIPYATLESLFGSMDYCTCEHCRSVLSPAAYLVDLLQFLDRSDLAANKNPLNILLQRRPDIEHLPLSCENTNTQLPYIDLVNETLEYFITTGNLDGYRGYSTAAENSSEELLASPQNVRDEAYTTLAAAYFPQPLPFHQPLETLRRYFDKFETPLPAVMEALRTHDLLERPAAADPANPIEYGWRDILMEGLRMSRAEHAILTERAPVTNNTQISRTLNRLYGYAPATAEANVLSTLRNVKAYAHRVGISYIDLIEILKTRFINPHAALIPQLEHLGVTFARLKELKNSPLTGTAWLALLPQPPPDPVFYGGSIEIWVKNESNYARIMKLILVTNPTDDENQDNFDKLEFRYSNPDNNANQLSAFAFIRLMRFIRLWRKLGWSIEQTDKAITALYPESQSPNDANDTVNLQRLDTGFLTMLPRLGVLVRVMRELKLKPKRDLLPLLACFARIDTHGISSLYRQMFLTAVSPKEKSLFVDDGFGNYLIAEENLLDHRVALRAAFQLTDEEFNHIVSDLGYQANTLLNLITISAIFRRGWLARKLKLSVREFCLLVQMSGIDPFAPPDVGALPTPVPPILRFIDLASRLRAALKSEQALYLIWNQDISGKSAPDRSEILEFARSLRATFAAVEGEFALSDDPTGQIARARMALVYGNAATDFFFGLLDNTIVTTVPYDHDQETLERAILVAAPGRIAYDNFAKRLSFSGVMSKEARDALWDASTNAAFKIAIYSTVPEETNLYTEIQKTVNPFFVRYPELQPLFELYAFFGELNTWVTYNQPEATLTPDISQAGAGRLTYDHMLGRLFFKGVMGKIYEPLWQAAESIPALQTAVDELLSASLLAVEKFFQRFAQRYPDLSLDQAAYIAANDAEAERRTLLLAAFLPQLKYRRKRQQALAAISAATKTELAFASAILDDKRVLNPAATPTTANLNDLSPALDDLTALESAGLLLRLYAGATVSGPAVQPGYTSMAEANLAYPATGVGALPFSPASGIWSGYLEAPENGFYNFSISPGAASGAGASNVSLTLNGEEKPLEKNGEVWSNTTAIELRAGLLYRITLVVENITAGLTVRWQTTGRGWEVIPAAYLYPVTLTAYLYTTYTRFLKISALATGLKLQPSELTYFAAHDAYQIDNRGWLNRLPVTGRPNSAISTRLLKAFEALLDFAALKARLAPNDERLLVVLKDPNATIETAEESIEQEKVSLLLAVTRWEGSSLDALLLHFGKHLSGQPTQADRAALKELDTFVRVDRAYALVKKIGVSASALIATTTNEPQGQTVHTFKAALRARYEESDWLNVLKPISDELRGLQRDALVAYILHRLRADPLSAHIDTPEKLFEYFLMDVQMEPCMQTSRIRHALSSVQLFIERCIMNLETRVAPSVFEPTQRKQWEWMKRYRVWEANRKVFLWPENWVEPELRGDQSPFFKEALSELLQSDITDDRAATALLNYLTKLGEVAHLEPCGIHFVEGDPGTADDIAHVVAHSAGVGRQYYYCRCENGLWTPWEPIKLDIEDTPVIPVVWKDRLFLFWLKILKQAPMDAEIPQNTNAPKKQNSEEEKSLAECTPNELKKDAQATAQKSARVTVQALLCWSEYFNGKWQPAKTSAVNRPAVLGLYAGAGSTQFNRAELSLWMIEDEGSGALHVLIRGGRPNASFTLYNTHSAPLASDQALDLTDQPKRALYSQYDDLSISHWQKWEDEKPPDNQHALLTTALEDYTVQPQHLLKEPSAAPFFYADRRHVFHVTMKKVVVPFQHWNVFYHVGQSVWDASISPLLMPKYQPPGSGPYELPMSEIDQLVTLQRFVTEDAHINIAIALKNAVQLNGTLIGPTGSIVQSIEH